MVASNRLMPLLLVTLAVGASGCTSSSDATPLHQLPGTTPSASAGLSQITPTRSQQASNITVTGTIQPARTADVFGPYPARVQEVHVDEGSVVEAGAALVSLDTSIYRLQTAQARAQAASTQVQLEQARTEHARLAPLARQGVVSQQQVDQIEAQADAIEESLEAINAMMRLSQVQVRDGSVVAPFPGIITRVNVEAGTMSTGGVALVRLVDMSEVDVRLTVPEAWMTSLTLGQSVEINVPALGQRHTGSVRFINPEMDANTRAGEVLVRVANPDGQLLSGAFADARLTQNGNGTRLTVPAQALLRTSSGTFAFVVRDGVAHRLQVEATSTLDGWEIRSGLNGTETLLSGDLTRVTDGMSLNAAAAQEN